MSHQTMSTVAPKRPVKTFIPAYLKVTKKNLEDKKVDCKEMESQHVKTTEGTNPHLPDFGK